MIYLLNQKGDYLGYRSILTGHGEEYYDKEINAWSKSVIFNCMVRESVV